jgi:uncharacterized protein YneF (UPF0154 family)
LTLQCEGGARPKLSVGDKIPNTDKALAVVVGEQENSVLVGLLQGGELKLKYPCENGEQEILIKLEVPKDADKLKKFMPIGPSTLPYPSGLIVALIIILIVLVLSTLGFYLRKKWIKKKVVVADKPLTLEEKILAELQSSKRKIFIDETQFQKLRYKYETLIELIRKYLEDTLKLQTEFFTSKELIVYVRSLSAVRDLSDQRLAQLESLFVRAEQVRFAGHEPSIEEKEIFLDDLDSIYKWLKQKRDVNDLRKS